jgi:outer membrane protein OmpA-like peptidoglycan-associated protein
VIRAGVLLLAVACAPRHNYPGGGGLEDQLEREVVALQQKARSLESALATCGEEESRLYTNVHQIFAGSEAVVSREGRFTSVTLPAHYAFGSEVTLRREARMAFDLLSMVLEETPGATLQITGHTESRMLTSQEQAQFADMMGLGFFMARTLRDALVEDFGVEASRVVVASVGAERPVAENDTPAGQRANRRVVVLIDEPVLAP